jgi:hypothetical protein
VIGRTDGRRTQVSLKMARGLDVGVLALVGIVLVSVSIFDELSSMDLGKFSLLAYLRTDLWRLSWWSAIGFPLVLGASYLGIVALALRKNLATSAKLMLYSCCLVAASALVFVNFLGIYASLCTITMIAYVARFSFTKKGQ